MPDHLNREQIAALLDELGAPGADREHLDACVECTREYEQMVRMRMALSALPDLAPPLDEWEKIRSRLATDVIPVGRGARFPGSFSFRPVWAAAVVALFAAGLGVGRQLSPPGTVDSSATTTGSVDASNPGQELNPTDDPTAAYLRTVAQIEELRREGPSGESVWENPSLAVERLTRLDALIEASQEALRTAPSDPVLNNFLFDVVDERESLAGQMDRSLRYTSVEY